MGGRHAPYISCLLAVNITDLYGPRVRAPVKDFFSSPKVVPTIKEPGNLRTAGSTRVDWSSAILWCSRGNSGWQPDEAAPQEAAEVTAAVDNAASRAA